MFTGIIEEIAEVVGLKKDRGNVHISLASKITDELKIDQSICHNGVCLTVVDISADTYTVTVINETLTKTNLGCLKVGSKVNIERAMKLGARLDGHMVQGHVDQVGSCIEVREENGSYIFTFSYKEADGLTVEKGSVCVNGVSLTVVNSNDQSFSVAIIPYTYMNTNFQNIKIGQTVNLEFDILGKYISKMFIKNL